MNTLTVVHDFDLSGYTTFGFAQKAAHYVEVETDDQLADAVQLARDEHWPILPLGEGSNIVLTQDYNGLVIRQTGQRIEYVSLPENATTTDTHSIARTVNDKGTHSQTQANVETPIQTLTNAQTRTQTETKTQSLANAEKRVQSDSELQPDKPTQAMSRRMLVTAAAGVNWHTLVMDTVNKGLVGLENLSLIPGLVGAAPVQNIGAYGVELCDRFVSLKALHIQSGRWQTFTIDDCEFAYRDSLFKRHIGQYIIANVSFELGSHIKLQTGYGALNQYLDTHCVNQAPTAAIVSEAVCAIRRSKLPNPAALPNAGSFFHNPVIPAAQYTALTKEHPDMVGYRQPDGQYKVAAGWLIDHLGYKGYCHEGVGVHEHQALVLVKYAPATGSALLALANTIQTHVLRVFGITLSIEPRLI